MMKRGRTPNTRPVRHTRDFALKNPENSTVPAGSVYRPRSVRDTRVVITEFLEPKRARGRSRLIGSGNRYRFD